MFAAIEHVMIALAAGTGFQVAGIRTGLRFGQRKCAKHCTAGQGRQELAFLLFGAVGQNRYAPHRVVHAHDRGARSVACSDFFEGHGIGLITRVATAPRFWHQHAEETQFGHFIDGLAREAMLLVPFSGKRLQALLSKLACRFTNL